MTGEPWRRYIDDELREIRRELGLIRAEQQALQAAARLVRWVVSIAGPSAVAVIAFWLKGG